MVGRNEQFAEKRVFERFPARFPAKFQHSREDFGSDVFLRDASAQGIRLATRQKMFLNDSLSLLIKLPDGGEPMVLNGRVVWIKSKDPSLWEIGLEFHDPQLMTMQRLYRFVELPE